MPGLSPNLSRHLRETLSRCGPFDSDRSLRTVFVDARLAHWRDSVPDADARASRVRLLINALLDRQDIHGNPALALFVEVLAESAAPEDACYAELTTLAAELRRALIGESEARSKRRLKCYEEEIDAVEAEMAQVLPTGTQPIGPSSESEPTNSPRPTPVVIPPIVTPTISRQGQVPDTARQSKQQTSLRTWIEQLFDRWLWPYYIFIGIVASTGFVADIGPLLGWTLCTQRWLFTALASVGGVLILGVSFLSQFYKKYQHWDRWVTIGLTCLISVPMAFYANRVCTNQCPSVEL